MSARLRLWWAGAANTDSAAQGRPFHAPAHVFEDKKNILPFCVAIIAFLAVLVETVIIQQKSVDAAKKLNPEKTASVYDMKFQKKWMESCDEAEKIMIGKCAYKAYAATNTACAILALVLAFSALIFETGFLEIGRAHV